MHIALFPLKTVLFPGGVLPLRIFEARYMDMVRDCMREQKPFGVCLITQGGEVGEVPRFEAVGCLADIESWDMQQLGVLNIRCVGRQRFRVQREMVRVDNLVTADVELLPADDEQPLGTEYKPCVDLLRKVVDDQLAQAKAAAEGDLESAAPRAPFEPPYQFESSVWVGNRLCEVLPVPLKAKQKLMELDDATTRLSIVSQYLRQHAVIK